MLEISLRHFVKQVDGIIRALLLLCLLPPPLSPLLSSPLSQVPRRRCHRPCYLKYAVAEVVKAAKHEATLLPAEAESYRQQINTKLVDLRNNVKDEELDIDFAADSASHETQNISASKSGIDINEWENIVWYHCLLHRKEQNA